MSVKREKAGVRLYEVFIGLGWTKVRASQEFGVSENMIYKYCNMDTFSPHLYKKMVGLLKRKYNVNPDYISSDSDDMFLSEADQGDETTRLRKEVADLHEVLKQVAEEAGKQTALIQQLTRLLLPKKT